MNASPLSQFLTVIRIHADVLQRLSHLSRFTLFLGEMKTWTLNNYMFSFRVMLFFSALCYRSRTSRIWFKGKVRFSHEVQPCRRVSLVCFISWHFSFTNVNALSWCHIFDQNNEWFLQHDETVIKSLLILAEHLWDALERRLEQVIFLNSSEIIAATSAASCVKKIKSEDRHVFIPCLFL